MEATIQEITQWTVLSLIEWGTQYLQEREIESARLNCELLLCHVLNCRRIDLYLKFGQPLSTNELGAFKGLLKRRIVHEPLQYILGETEFMGLKFVVDRRVFIPRPETELVVEEIIMLLRKEPPRDLRILEIGTGSGNIAISLAKYISGCYVETIELSDDAISVARDNIIQHRCENHVTVIKGGIFREGLALLRDSYDVIVSNPPYISIEEFQMLPTEVKGFEPTLALTDGADGLRFYRVIAELGKHHLLQGGWVVVEIAYNLADQVMQLFGSAGYPEVQTIRDYDNNVRIVKAQFHGEP